MNNSPRDGEFARGSQFELQASASGTPAPSYEWFANGQKVGEGRTFSDVMKSDYEGQYKENQFLASSL